MNKKVIALIIAIIIFIVIAGIVFAIYLQNDNENNNNNISQVQNNNSNVQHKNGMILINGGTFQMGSPEDEMQLAPNSKIGEGLSIHYSGGSSLESDINMWLETNGIAEQ